MEELKMYIPVSTRIEDGIKSVLRKAEQIGQRVVADFNGFLIDSNYSYEKNLELFYEHFKRPTPKKDYRNWEQRRYEIAKTMLPIIYRIECGDFSIEKMAVFAVKSTDTLIKELKKSEQND